MIQAVQKLIKHVLTGIDGETYDIARVMWVLGSLFYFGMTAWVVLHNHQPFDFQQWALGFGGVMAGAGVSIKLKENTEPVGN